MWLRLRNRRIYSGIRSVNSVTPSSLNVRYAIIKYSVTFYQKASINELLNSNFPCFLKFFFQKCACLIYFNLFLLTKKFCRALLSLVGSRLLISLWLRLSASAVNYCNCNCNCLESVQKSCKKSKLGKFGKRKAQLCAALQNSVYSNNNVPVFRIRIQELIKGQKC